MSVYQQGTPIEISDTFTVDGIETNPTTVTYTILGPDGTITVYTFPGAAEISHPSVGNFLLSLAPPALPGEYQYDVDATGTVVASRAASFTVLANVATATDLDWAVMGPCTPWADSQDVWDCCGQPMTTIGEGSSAIECPVDMTQFAMEASQLLYELSGRLFAGSCSKTVRPCGNRPCGFQVLSRGHIVDPWWDGAYWSWNGTRGCGCQPLDRIKLSGYPVREITEVKIDGVVLTPAVGSPEYRLDERRYLTRMRDIDGNAQFWPNCQALDSEDTESGTFSVSYRYGQDPPILGIHAASSLGCELWKSCNNQPCALPTGTTRVTRQGIVIEKLAFSSWAFTPSTGSRGGRIPGWHTGIPNVDAFLGSYAATGLKRRPIFWSPGAIQYARSIGQ